MSYAAAPPRGAILPRVEIIGRSVWRPAYPLGRAAPLPAGEVWLHHDDTKAGREPRDEAAECAHMRQLEAVGHERFGGTVSYTFAVMPSGRVYEGHGVDRRGTHTKGHNTVGRAIVVVGEFGGAVPTPAALESIAQLLADGARAGWWRTPALTGGHRDVRGTACPGDRLYGLIRDINARAAALATGTAPAPAPEPVLDDGGGMQALVQVKGQTAVYVTNGITRRWVQSPAERRELVKIGLVEDTVKDVSAATLKRLTLIGPEPK